MSAPMWMWLAEATWCDGPGADEVEAALLQWRFEPPRRGSERATRVVVEVELELGTREPAVRTEEATRAFVLR